MIHARSSAHLSDSIRPLSQSRFGYRGVHNTRIRIRFSSVLRSSRTNHRTLLVYRPNLDRSRRFTTATGIYRCRIYTTTASARFVVEQLIALVLRQRTKSDKHAHTHCVYSSVCRAIAHDLLIITIIVCRLPVYDVYTVN